MEFDKEYKFLLELDEQSKQEIEILYRAWLKDIQKIANSFGGGEYFAINEEYLKLAVLDYFADIARLKQFHGIDDINFSKECGYGIFWLVRRKPLQTIADKLPPKFHFVNEKAVTVMFLNRVLTEIGLSPKNLSMAQREIANEFNNSLTYHLRFRHFTQQSLELAVDAFCAGFKLGKTA